MIKVFKSIIAVCLLIMISNANSSAQVSFSHSLGASFYFSEVTSSPGVMYSPRLNFIELGDEVTVSAGTHIGAWLDFNSRSGGSYSVDLPVVAEINFGHASHPDTKSKFGGFAGLGYGYNQMATSDNFGSSFNTAIGPVVNGGLRFIINENPIGLRGSYLLNTNAGNADVISVGLFYTLGMGN